MSSQVPLALFWGVAASLALSSQNDQGEAGRRSRTYLRQGATGWVEITRDESNGVLLGASVSVAASAVFERSDLFKPFLTIHVGSLPEAVAIGDLNDDGLDDVALTTSYYFDPDNDGKLFVFLQTVNGLTAPAKYDVGGTPSSMSLGDLNDDGLLDVVVGKRDGISVFLQNGSGTLDAPGVYATGLSRFIETGDFNDDGRTDVFGIGWAGTDVAVYLQNLSGTLDGPTVYSAPHGGFNDVASGDVNGDGRDDIIIMSGQGLGDNVAILVQNTTGTFHPVVTYDLPANVNTNGVAVGDVDNDGRNDVVVTYGGNKPSSHIAVFAQNTGGTLDPPVSYDSYDIPRPVEIADLNGDGRRDMAVLHGSSTEMGTHLQNPDGTLAPEKLDAIPNASHFNRQGLALGDLNDDGLTDAAISSKGQLVILYHEAGHDLRISLSDAPDPVGLGATVTVTFTLTVENVGTSALTGVVATLTLPAGLTFVSASLGCAASGGVVTCPIGSLAPGAVASFDVAATPFYTGTLVTVASATSSEPDALPYDDTAQESTTVLAPSCTERVLDGGFELGIPNPVWSEFSLNFGTPLCTFFDCGSGASTAGPRLGNVWAWFGGLSNALEAGTVSQSVVLPTGRATLQFYLWIGASSGNDQDFLTASIDGTPVVGILESDPAYASGYQPVVVDVSSFADGGAHLLSFDSNTFGPDATNFSVDDVSIQSCAPPLLSIAPSTVTEGDVGAVAAVFELTLSDPSPIPVTVPFGTLDGSATAGLDYLETSGHLTLAPGATASTITVTVLGDFAFEEDETFEVLLGPPVGAILMAPDAALGTILNDDLAGLTIEDVTVTEPLSGSAVASFRVALHPAATETVTVDYATSDGSATVADGDYLAASGTLTFDPGTTQHTVEVSVLFDGVDEGPEAFTVGLSMPSGAALARDTGTGHIVPPGFFTLDPCRLVDTRLAVSQLGGPALAAGDDRLFLVGGACGVPANARAISLNIAVTGATAPGNVRLHPGGSAIPLTSSINYVAGQTRSNNAIVPLDVLSRLAAFVGQSSGTVHLIVDVNGYFQ